MAKNVTGRLLLTPIAIVAAYVIVGLLWVFGSDWLVEALFSHDFAHEVQTYKGFFFVFVTAGVLYLLIRKGVSRARVIEAERLQSLKRYDDLVENANDGIFTLDTDGRFTEINRAVEKITGYTREEILSLKFEDILAPEHKEYVQLLLDPQHTQNPAAVSELRIVRKDRAIAYIEVSSRPLSTLDSRTAIENIARDVTQRHIMQTALEAAKIRYQSLIETANEGILTVDSENKITLVNRKFYEMSGFSSDGLIGRPLGEVFGEKFLNQLDASSTNSNPGDRDHFDYEFTCVDGRKIWLLMSSTPLMAKSDVSGRVFMATDITERKTAEVRIRESEARFRVLFEQSPIGGLIMTLQGQLIDVNPAGAEMLGYSIDELRSMSVPDFDLEHTVTDIEEKVRLVNDSVSRLQFQTRYRIKSGAIADVFVAASLLNIDGQTYGYAAWLDVTQYQNATRELRRSEERLQSLYQIISSPHGDYRERVRRILELGVSEFGVVHGLFGLVSNGQYTVIESAGGQTAELNGLTCAASETLCSGLLRPGDCLAFEDLSATEFAEHPATARFDVGTFIGVPVTSDGNVLGSLCFFGEQKREEKFTVGDREFLKLVAQWIGAELTRHTAEEALLQSEEQLLQAQKLESVGRLAGGIAHDFNNMLTAINGYSDLILSKMDRDNPLRHNIGEIRKAGERSAALTQQLLAFSRKQILKPEIININQAVLDVLTLLGRLIGEDIVLATDLSPHVHDIEVDPGQFSQIIVNLAVNARDAMPRGGKLTISTSNSHGVQSDENGGGLRDVVRLTVTDTGVGMDEETRRQLFEPFFTTKDVGKGTGLGLATVYGFIKQSGGYVTVESEVSKGTSFNVFLPQAAKAKEETPVDTSLRTSRIGAETILLVEDEDIVRKLGYDVLTASGYKVIEAAGGVEALEICANENLEIDLLFTDVVMPQMNGRELWEKLAAERPEMKVLFTSGYTDDMVVRSGIRNEETNFLQKPFAIDTLIEKVREVLDSDGVIERSTINGEEFAIRG